MTTTMTPLSQIAQPAPEQPDNKAVLLPPKSKIVATLGPASEQVEVLEQLIKAGLRVARVNMSHGEYPEHQQRIENVRQASKNVKIPVAVLADLQGPKIRTGKLDNGEAIQLVNGETIKFAISKEPGNASCITSPTDALIGELAVGTTLLINDGALRLRIIEELSPNECMCTIVQGGPLTERKGINLPDKKLKISALTEKDKKDALFAMEQGVEYIAMSFVQSADDIRGLKTYLLEKGYKHLPPIVAKIEKPQALSDMDDIFDEVGVVMVARGDLGVELSPEHVPIVQKLLVQKGLDKGKPVIVATQMLESMTHSPTATRAEVSDVANAVFDGADALMLSGETAVGEFPVETITTMNTVIAEAQIHQLAMMHESRQMREPQRADEFHQSIAQAASFISRKTDIKAIVVLSSSGSMATRLSKLRPTQPIIALTEREDVLRRMSLLWGVTPILTRFGETTDATLNEAEAAILKQKLLKVGDNVLFCSGNTPIVGMTNMIKFFTLGEAIRSATSLLAPNL